MIRALSFDFDGCIFNNNYKLDQGVIQCNKTLFENIKNENKKFSKIYIFIGSNRQSKLIDQYNAINNQNGSCFPAIEEISNYFEATLDPLLLADIFGGVEAGTSYKLARDLDYKGKHHNFVFDETKVTLTYAQMHKIANENPNEQIIFDFYDDKEDILDWLESFYSKYPHLIPANVTLRLFLYAGTDHRQPVTITGKGFIDEKYRQTVIDLSNQASSKKPGNTIKVAKYAIPDELSNRKEIFIPSQEAELKPRETTISLTQEQGNIQQIDQNFNQENLTHTEKSNISLIEYEEQKKNKKKFDEALNEIINIAAELDMRAKKFYNKKSKDKQNSIYYSCKNAAQDALNLHKSVLKAVLDYSKDRNKSKFENSIDQAITTAAQSELKNHRSPWNHIHEALSIILTILTCGLAYVIASGIKYYTSNNRSRFFTNPNKLIHVETNSIKKVYQLKNTAKKFIGNRV